MPSLDVYLFKVRDSISGQWQQTRYPMTIEMARARFREGNYELLEWSREVRVSDPVRLTATHSKNSPDE